MLTWRIWTYRPQPRFRPRDLHALLELVQKKGICSKVLICYNIHTHDYNTYTYRILPVKLCLVIILITMFATLKFPLKHMYKRQKNIQFLN